MNKLEERLEGLKETVAIQQNKINDMDHKIDALESALRYERNVNKTLIRFLEKKFGNEFKECIESNC